ncbi:uncharacterized protein FA14DRAFT_176114 [Meira miltonrushii]|uniref:Uncharacterized protein n=1 Tax=Meira miltonrushii TaxID=1280837 RepID=A0A316VID7_9BASI|nr:uncharacterized protein FA14DRAFT_176114 [Meira miltonrushii]PWN36808.1 hypothetical protein FA14DRAFT_176114 [Meira miltonrushii]
MANLLDLPFELHCEITNQLPLAARIIYQTQICKHLRIVFAGRFTLPQPSSFRLVEWRRASSEVAKFLQRDEQQKLEGEGETLKAVTGEYMQVPTSKKSIWDTSPSSTPKPAPAKLRVPFQNSDEVSALAGITSQKHGYGLAALSATGPSDFLSIDGNILDSLPHADHSDVDLFARCLKLLGRLNDNRRNIPDQQPWLATPLLAIPIRVLSLLSRTGFKVASLIYLLQNVPALHSVETILMTSAGNAELILWSLFQPSRQAFQWPHTVSPVVDINADEERIPLEASTCSETQAIVVPGPFAPRGQGLRSGFKCLCFHPAHQNISDGDSKTQLQFTTEKAFHVIFHDWYDEAEAEGTQDMLHYSDITCNACKQTIVF